MMLGYVEYYLVDEDPLKPDQKRQGVSIRRAIGRRWLRPGADR